MPSRDRPVNVLCIQCTRVCSPDAKRDEETVPAFQRPLSTALRAVRRVRLRSREASRAPAPNARRERGHGAQRVQRQ